MALFSGHISRLFSRCTFQQPPYWGNRGNDNNPIWSFKSRRQSFGLRAKLRCRKEHFLKPKGCSQPSNEERRRRVVGIGSLGEITLATNLFWGNSLRFSVAINAARPCSAHAQNALSSGSGDTSLATRTSRNSASSLSRLIIAPMRFRRTPSLVRTPLYSATMSSVMSQMNVPFSSQSRRSEALWFSALRPDLNPATPATSTDVSITPLGFSRRPNRDLRQLFSFSSEASNCLRHGGVAYAGQVTRCRL